MRGGGGCEYFGGITRFYLDKVYAHRYKTRFFAKMAAKKQAKKAARQAKKAACITIFIDINEKGTYEFHYE
jgi:hypothetical protein